MRKERHPRAKRQENFEFNDIAGSHEEEAADAGVDDQDHVPVRMKLDVEYVEGLACIVPCHAKFNKVAHWEDGREDQGLDLEHY
eukprot:CAMPEP_0119315776 /NCGR_PEP_ID=MMETSP1333-20130426/37110_1 /TAXON_ID=418940 /ORGANISM="Scyphosphaera apsteinii, Strain RCC1455" /LENGTH=83 /DNA_ID=CAMNT_0007321227 /DNA_START=302 /DNA_END=553 /DNA_ORIENTATION=-